MKLNYDLKPGMSVKIESDWIMVFDENNNDIYRQFSDGFWYKKEYDEKGRVIHSEDSDGHWYEKQYDSEGNEINYKNSNGDWSKKEYNDKGKMIYWKNSYGDWFKREYNDKGERIYFEDSNGYIVDNRPKLKLTKEERTFVKSFKDVEYIAIKNRRLGLHFYNSNVELFRYIDLRRLNLEFKGLKRDIEYKVDNLEVEK